MEHCDHLKLSAWKGDLVARSCNPQAAWSAGHAHAEDILHTHHVGADFTEVFGHTNINMLQLLPDGIYPGISAEADLPISTHPKSHPIIQHEPVDDDGDDEYKDEIDDEMDVCINDILDEPPASAHCRR